MEVIIFLRLLWRRRIHVGVGILVALAIAVALGGGPVPSGGVAATVVLVDTPRSSLIATSADGAKTLYWRATLLAMLLSTDPARDQIARETHIPVSQIAVLDHELTIPANAAVLPVAALQAASATPQPYVVRVDTDNARPIISVHVTAPHRAGAARLAEAAAHALQAGASPRDTAQVQGLSITQVGPVTAKEIGGGGGRMTMALKAFVVFVLWCAGVTVSELRRGHRRQRRLTRQSPSRPALVRRLHAHLKRQRAFF